MSSFGSNTPEGDQSDGMQDELQQLLERDMQIGWELHRREGTDGREAVESLVDG
jgi:hypothetical protein